MDASSIIDIYGRGIPAIVHNTMIVDVCAYLRSSQSPAALVISERGEIRGVLSQKEIVHSGGRIGSSIMQMTAGELAREQSLVCQSDASLSDILQLLSETGNEFIIVCDGTTVKGLITVQDITELLSNAMSGSDESEAMPEQPAMAGEPAPQVQPAQSIQMQQPSAPEAYQVAAAPQPAAAAPQQFQQAPPVTQPVMTSQTAPAPQMQPAAQLQPAPAANPFVPQVPEVPPASAYGAAATAPASSVQAPGYNPQYATAAPQAAAAIPRPGGNPGWAKFEG